VEAPRAEDGRSSNPTSWAQFPISVATPKKRPGLVAGQPPTEINRPATISAAAEIPCYDPGGHFSTQRQAFRLVAPTPRVRKGPGATHLDSRSALGTLTHAVKSLFSYSSSSWCSSTPSPRLCHQPGGWYGSTAIAHGIVRTRRGCRSGSWRSSQATPLDSGVSVPRYGGGRVAIGDPWQ
jgi:hypothetical protein